MGTSSQSKMPPPLLPLPLLPLPPLPSRFPAILARLPRLVSSLIKASLALCQAAAAAHENFALYGGRDEIRVASRPKYCLGRSRLFAKLNHVAIVSENY